MTAELPPLLAELVAQLPAEGQPFPAAARSRWLGALRAVTILLWPTHDEERAEGELLFGVLDADGRLTDASGHNLWNIVAYLPEGREGQVARFLTEHGIEIYRMWQPGAARE